MAGDKHISIEYRKSKIENILVCPDCRQPLKEESAALRCGSCGAAFPPEGGVPKLWPPSRAAEIERSIACYQAPHAGVRASRFFRSLLPPNPICDPGAKQRAARVKAALADGIVLNLGSKDTHWGAHVVNVDLVLPSIENRKSKIENCILADLHRLPFADASVDGIICTNVLEHVAEPQMCLDEITRVLKPGGQVYITVPFIFPVHPDPLDRWRWTLDGLRNSLRGFDELEAGVCGGPFSAFVSIMPTLLASVFSNFYLFNAVRCALGWLLWPLKFLDHIAWRSAKAHMAAAGSFYLGRKK